MNSKKYKDVLYEVREITDLRDMIRSSAELFSDDPAFLVKEVPAGEYVPITYRTLKSDIDCLGTYFAKVGMKGKKISCYWRKQLPVGRRVSGSCQRYEYRCAAG